MKEIIAGILAVVYVVGFGASLYFGWSSLASLGMFLLAAMAIGGFFGSD